MSFLKLLSVLAVAVLVTAQHPPEGPSFDLNRHMQCRGCVLQGLQWCAKSSASDYDGSCIKITEHCESGAVATTKAEGCPNDTPASKRSCSLCVFDAYSWCQDRRFPRDEYAGHCVAAPNMSTPGQQQAPTTPPSSSSNPNEQPAANPAEGQEGPEDHNSEEGDDGNNELDSALCGEGARLILRPQGCATALNPPRHPDDDHDHDDDHDGPQQDKKHRWSHAKGAMIAFGIFKVALIVTCLCCCCRKKCRQRCRERCHRWHHHYHGLPEQQQVNSTVANPNGSAVALNGGCSFVGGSEDQQVQQAMAASLKPQATIASAPAPVNVMVNIPASTDRKDRNGVEMMHHYPGAAYPSLATSAGYMPVQTHPADV